MSNIPHVQMLVPGLCGPLPDIQQIVADVNAEKLFLQMAKANVSSVCSHDLHTLLIDLFELKLNKSVTSDSFPSAALSLLGCVESNDNNMQKLSDDITNNLDSSEHYFLHADPVHLRAEMDHAVLVGTQDLNLTELEAKEFCDALHQHFKEDGVEIFAVDADHWYVKLKTKHDICTVNLSDAVGRNVNFILPSGKDEVYWKQFLNESQMLLHMHNNNEKRESRGQLPVNSVWVHGGGSLSDLSSSAAGKLTSVCADDVLLKGLAKHCQLPASHKLDNAEAFYGRVKTEEMPLLYIDSLLPWLNYTDTSMWQQQLENLYLIWLKPLLEMVRQGKIQLTLYPCNNKRYAFKRYSSYKFWRKAKMENYVSTY